MNHHKIKMFWSVGLVVTAVSFGLIWFGIKMILQQTMDIESILAFVLISIAFGGLCGAFYALDLKAALAVFTAGIIIGFFAMYWHFIAGMDGWGDLTGVLSLVIYAGIGLAAALLVQFIWQAIRKKRNR